MEQTPIIGVVLITYGRRQSLFDTIATLKRQTWQDWRCIIMDQNPAPVPYDEDDRIRRVWRPDDPSMYKARNLGLETFLDEGVVTHVCFWDDDDLIVDDYMAKMIQPFVDDATIEVVRCRIKHRGKVMTPKAIATNSRMVRANAITAKLRWKVDSVRPDKDFWQRFAHMKHHRLDDDVLIETGINPIGGTRHRNARL